MTFIETIPEADADGAVAEIYEADRTAAGEVPNYTRAFSLRPEVYAAWRQLNGAIKADTDLRRYELSTVAAARRLGSSYCALAHGAILADRFLGPDAVRKLMATPAEEAAAVGRPDLSGRDEVDAATPDAAGLGELDAAVVALADKVAGDATSVTEHDLDRLRSLGLTDTEIFDVVAAAAARCFFSKLLDALGTQPDARFAALDPALRDALTVGRPIAEP